nr:MAG TPA_asm: hypothetical protein [Caudoviricetes sp.]
MRTTSNNSATHMPAQKLSVHWVMSGIHSSSPFAFWVLTSWHEKFAHRSDQASNQPSSGRAQT